MTQQLPSFPSSPSSASNRDQDLSQALQVLCAAMCEMVDCLLDLEWAVEELHAACDPALSRALEHDTADCLNAAMRR